MAIPNIKRVDTCINIIYVDGNGNQHPIKKVLYYDQVPTEHTVWDNTGGTITRIEELYIVELNDSAPDYYSQALDQSTSYQIDTNTQEPTVYLLPNKNYAIKGDIVTRRTGTEICRVTDAYLTLDTTSSSGQSTIAFSYYQDDNVNGLDYRGRTAKYKNQGDSSWTNVSSSNHFSVFRCDNNLYSNTPTWNLMCHSNFGVITGFIFDDNDTTPLILKRIVLSEECELFDTNNQSVLPNGIAIDTNNPVTLVPKTRVAGTNYASNWSPNTNWVITNNTNWCTITSNNGVYTFTANGNVPDSNGTTITFTSSNGTNLVLDFGYVVAQNSSETWDFTLGGNNAGNNQLGFVLNASKVSGSSLSSGDTLYVSLSATVTPINNGTPMSNLARTSVFNSENNNVIPVTLQLDSQTNTLKGTYSNSSNFTSSAALMEGQSYDITINSLSASGNANGIGHVDINVNSATGVSGVMPQSVTPD